MGRLKALFIQKPELLEQVYGLEDRRAIESLVDVFAPPLPAVGLEASAHLLQQVELIFTGWGAPAVTEQFLDAAPRLKAIFYAGGAASGLVSDRLWDRGIQVTSAYAANGVPVAEFCLGMILIGLKNTLRLARQVRAEQAYPPRAPVLGAYGRTVGLVSMGMIGRQLRDLLRAFDLEVIAYDPFLSDAEAAALDIERVPLSELFERSDAISVHAPWLPETEGLIGGAHLASMKRDAVFINTARGAVVREAELIQVAQQRPDLQFMLDVTHPEPPATGSPLYTLDNVLLTPHIAGSMGRECQRMGRSMLEELERYLNGQPMRWVITRELAMRTSHRPPAGAAHGTEGPKPHGNGHEAETGTRTM